MAKRVRGRGESAGGWNLKGVLGGSSQLVSG